jgi:cytochrome c2
MKTKILFAAIALSLSLNTFADTIINEGKTLFAARCATCHKLGSVLVGPDLIDVDQRRDMGWIIRFVNSSQSLIKNGDKDAVTLYEKFNKFQMPDQSDLKEIEIKSLVAFIKSEKNNLTVSDAPFARPQMPKANYRPLSIHNYGFILSYLALIGVLVAVLFFAVNVGLLKRTAAGK